MKRRLFSCLVLTLLSSMAALAQPTSDTTPPQLVSLSFNPPSVDVTAGAQTVTVTARVTDDLSGVFTGRSTVSFTGPNLQFLLGVYFNRISGTPLDGTYQAIITIPRYAEAGTWKVRLQLYDSAGNGFSPAARQLELLGFPTDLTVLDATPDLQPPNLLSITFSPTTIDVSAADVDVTVTLQISDDVSGVDLSGPTANSLNVAIGPTSSPSVRQYIVGRDFRLVSGNALNGTWKAVKTIPRYSPAGPWQLVSVGLFDFANNQLYRTAAQLAAAGISPVLTVESSPTDVTPPTLSAIGFSPTLINTSPGAQTVGITVSVSDDLSGVDLGPTTATGSFLYVQLRSPSGNQFTYVDPFVAPTTLGGTPLNGTWQMSATWPQYSEQGTWKLQLLTLKDRARNQVTYTPAMLEAMGLPDSIVVMKPSLTSDGTVGSAGGTVTDSTFGSRALVTFPPGLAPENTAVSIDVFSSPVAVPTPRGFTVPGTYFVNLQASPPLPSPLPAPGITVVLPLPSPMTVGATLSLYHIDPVTGGLAPAMDVFHHFVVGTVDSGGLTATFLNVVTVSTVVAYVSNGSVLGDVNGDGLVNCADVSLVKGSFGKRTGQPGFNSAADFNNDGLVDIKDLFIVTRQLPAGTRCQ